MRKPTENLIYGKLPPQDIELEKAVLGACMLEKETYEDVAQFIKSPEYFYKEEHQAIWQAMSELAAAGHQVDLLTITDKLRKIGKLEQVGGAYTLTMLSAEVTSSAHSGTHAKIITEKYLARESIRISGETLSNSYDETRDVFDTINTALTSLSDLQGGSITKMPRSAAELTKEHRERVSGLQKATAVLSGIPTGFPTLDEFTSGWQNQDLIILAARPSVGKTAFVLNLALNAAEKDFPVAFFSLEMSSLSLLNRAIASLGNIELYKFVQSRRMNQSDMETYMLASDKFSKLKLFIDEQAAMSVSEVRAKARTLKRKHGIKMIIIDYLQLMRGKGGNRETEISGISRDLKAMAKDLDVPVIALSQLSRALEGRTNKVPQLSDLRESGAIEQDADVVTFLYRPEYHGIANDSMGESTEGLTELHFGKFRNGEIGAKIDFIFQKEYQLFKDKEANTGWDNPAAGISKPVDFGGSKMFVPQGYQDPSQPRSGDVDWDK